MTHRHNWILVALSVVLLTCMAGSGIAGEDEVDTRVWSIHYWQYLAEKGLVPVNPEATAPPVVHLESVTGDSTDVAVINAGNTTQSETSVFVHPNDNTTALNSNNSTNWPVTTLYGTSYFQTNNSGSSWFGSVSGAGGSSFGDPAAAIGLNGRYYIGYISSSFGQGIAYSTNSGTSWTQNNFISGGTLDKNHLWIDNSPSSAYEGNLYASWTTFSSPYGEIEIMRSTTDGTSWVNRQTISTAVPAGSHHQGVNVRTGPNGEVYAVWAIYDQWSFNQYAEDGIGMAKSTNGGVSFDPGVEIIANIKGIRGEGSPLGSSWDTRTSSFPVAAVDISGGPMDGNVYVCWTNIGTPGVNTGDNWNVYLSRSEDGGSSWSTPVKVDGNTDGNGNGARNYFPWMSCDPETGELYVVYHDNRNTANNFVEIWMNQSSDGGVTWHDEIKISDVAFNPAPIPGLASGYMGDYIGVSARGGAVYPVWADNRAGNVLTYSTLFSGGGGGALSCGDIDILQARCKPSDGTTLQARVKLLTNAHNGETMTLDVDGVEYELTIGSFGFGDGVKMQIPNIDPGSHTVTVVDPAGCGLSATFDCGASTVAQVGTYDDWGFDSDLKAEQPIETALLGNYPNPFNPTTTISYALANDGFVSLKIYNTLGQEVATLVNEFQASGTFSATWNGTNNFGSAVSSGIYIYRLQTSDVVVTEKMMFMK